MRAVLFALAVLFLGSCDVKIRRGGIEPPPDAYKSLGLAPGAKLVELNSSREVDAVCRAEGIGPNEFQRLSGSTTAGCYSPKTRTVYMIARDKVPAAYWNELFDHEASGHSWGLVHGGRDHPWVTADGRDASTVEPQSSLAVARMSTALRQAAAEGEARAALARNPGLRLMTDPPPADAPKGLMGSSVRMAGK